MQYSNNLFVFLKESYSNLPDETKFIFNSLSDKFLIFFVENIRYNCWNFFSIGNNFVAESLRDDELLEYIFSLREYIESSNILWFENLSLVEDFYVLKNKLVIYSNLNSEVGYIDNKTLNKIDFIFDREGSNLNAPSKKLHLLPKTVNKKFLQSSFNIKLPENFYQKKNRVLGYIGDYSEELDVEFVNFLAKEYKGINFLFIGKGYEELFTEPNIRVMENTDDALLPMYLKLINVVFLPFKNNSSDSNIFKYLTTYKPIISTIKLNLPGKIYKLIKNKDEFEEALLYFLFESSKAKLNRVALENKFIKNKTWSNLASGIKNLLLNFDKEDDKLTPVIRNPKHFIAFEFLKE